MLEGFEHITADLTHEEMNLVPAFIAGFANKVGVDNAVTNAQIIQSFAKRGIKLSEPRVRKIINYIRNHAKVPGLIAGSNGYYISRNPHKVARYVRSLEGRELAIRAIKEKTKEYLKSLTAKQQQSLQF